jgi:Ricin-type beta-trefoil lectin domain-like
MSFTAAVTPATNFLTTAEYGTYVEKVKVSIPQRGAIAKIDTYFLSDTTGSMPGIIDAVKIGASDILTKLREMAYDVAADLYFGVGNYRDLNYLPDERFAHQQSLTSDTDDVTTAIRNWTTKAKDGGDVAEGQLYALDQLAQPPYGSIGWRPDAKRIVVWFGDAPGHDPICQAVSGLPYDITEQSVTAKLTEQGIVLLVISTPSGSSGPGLDVDPVPHSRGAAYRPCGDPGGRPGQGSRIAEASGGEYADNINADTIVETIIRLSGAEVARIGNVSLVADKQIAPFVTAVSPGSGYGPLAVGRPQDVDFDVSFAGVSITGGSASTTVPVTVNGSLDVHADGVTVGRKTVQITVPDLTGEYKIQCMKSGKFLQVESPSWTGDGGNVSQGSDTNGRYQQWKLIPVAEGGYQIKNMDTARTRYLEVPGWSTENNVEILTREDPSGRNKQWQLIPVGSDSDGIIYKIQNFHSGKVLDVKDGSTDEGIRILQYHYWGDWPVWQKNHQHHWRLLPL